MAIYELQQKISLILPVNIPDFFYVNLEIYECAASIICG